MCKPVFSLCAGFFVLIVLPLLFPIPADADNRARTSMKHTPPAYYVSGHRIQLDVTVDDPSGIELVRCYFKSAGEANFVFVPMVQTRKSQYAAVLPAPHAATLQVEYLFLSVNGANVIVKSQSFFMHQESRDRIPSWQAGFGEDEIVVSMELDRVPTELPGFSDNIRMDMVESGLRFGVVAGGLYHVTGGTGAAVSGTAAGATSAGTVTAGSTGIGTTTLFAASAGAAAGGVALAAVISSDSGSGGSSGAKVSEHYVASGPVTSTGSPQQRSTFQTGEGVLAYNVVRNVKENDTSYTLWQSPDGSTVRKDNPPATQGGSMSFSSFLEPVYTDTEGGWSVSFFYNDRKMYTDTFNVISGSGITLFWTY